MNSLRSLGSVATKLLEEPTENQAVFHRLAKENRLKDNIQRNPASVSQCPSRSEDGKEGGAERSLRMTRAAHSGLTVEGAAQRDHGRGQRCSLHGGGGTRSEQS